ncbi:MAG: MaoC family dehydratase [Desulfobacteraceae bacterium]|nr:MaoC family dehydratase [Desulfobacteraceae bacterium]
MSGKTISAIRVGDQAQFTKTISESDVYLYAGVTGDLNPAHINEEYAKNTFFKGRIAHGMLMAGFISTVVGMKLPGPGSIYLEQQLKFLAPVRLQDTITARVEVKEIDTTKNLIQLETQCINQDKKIVVDGKALISPPKKKRT